MSQGRSKSSSEEPSQSGIGRIRPIGPIRRIIRLVKLAEPKVNFVILAGCSASPSTAEESLQGRVLSMFDASDDVATTCQKTFAQAKGPLIHEEVVLKLGTGHGAFYRPGDWIGQVSGWVKQAGSGS